MIKRFYIFFLLLFIAGRSQAQFDTAFAKHHLLRCADSLVKSFLKKDWELYVKYTNPSIIGVLGGKEEFIRVAAASFEKIPDSAWKKYEPGKVLQVIKATSDLQAVVELYSVIEFGISRVTSTHHLVAESWNGGMHWTFFDSQNDRNATARIKPDLSPQLVIPPRDEKMEAITPATKKDKNQ